MCKTVEKIKELNFLALKMAYDLGYKNANCPDDDNPFVEYSDCWSCWNMGKQHAEMGNAPTHKNWRP